MKEHTFFQSDKFTESKIRGGKEVEKSFKVFNLHKMVHLFQNKKYLRT